MRRRTICSIVAVAAAAAGGVAGQAGAKPDAAATTLKLKAAASGAWKFNKKTLHASPGKVTIRLTNPSSADDRHAVEIEGKGVEKESREISPGGRTSVSARLKKGRYKFYCPVDGHRAAGMRGTLTVG